MKRLLSKACERLRDSHGFMLAEQLMSVLLLGFLTLAVAAGLGVCISVQRDISAETSAQSLLMRSIQEINDQLEFSSAVQDDGCTFVSSTMHQQVKFSSVNGEGIYLTQPGTSKPKTLLVGESNGMVAVFKTQPSYDKATNTWAYTVDIVDGSGNVVKTQEAAVKRVASSASSN